MGCNSNPNKPSMSAVVSIRLVSFTFNSSASLIILVPLACVHNSAIIGNSSIAFGTMSPSIRTGFKFGVYLTRIDAVGSDVSVIFKHSIFPSICLTISIIPERVGLMPTLWIVISLPGVISAATIKNAAEEISPGT